MGKISHDKVFCYDSTMEKPGSRNDTVEYCSVLISPSTGQQKEENGALQRAFTAQIEETQRLYC